MRKTAEFLCAAMETVVGVVVIAVFVSLGVAAGHTGQGKFLVLWIGAVVGVSTLNAFYAKRTGRPLIAWWPRPMRSLSMRLLFITPLFAFICYLLLYAALVTINGIRPEWLEP